MREINLTIVSGCLALQNKYKTCSVRTEDLFHQIAKRELERKFDIKLNIQIIRYERFSDCLEKIIKHFNQNPFDILVFQVRWYHYLNLVKLIGRYVNDQKRWKWTVNLPAINILNREKYPLERPYSVPKFYTIKEKLKESELARKLYYGLGLNELRAINYIVGSLIGNEKFAKKIYKRLIDNVINFCKEKNIPLIFVGVVSTPASKIRNYYSERLNEFVKPLIHNHNMPYINIFGYLTENNEYKFMEDKEHLNRIGHKEISKRLIEEIQRLLPAAADRHAPYRQREPEAFFLKADQTGSR